MRIKKIVLANLITERLIIYEKLERSMNSDGNIKKTTNKIKSLLKKVTTLNGMITEWEGIITEPTNPIEKK